MNRSDYCSVCSFNMSTKPRISNFAIMEMSTLLDKQSTTNQDWRLLSDMLSIAPHESDSYVQKLDQRFHNLNESPTTNVLRDWQQMLPVDEEVPAAILVGVLRDMRRIDAASKVEQLIIDDLFLDKKHSQRHHVHVQHSVQPRGCPSHPASQSSHAMACSQHPVPVEDSYHEPSPPVSVVGLERGSYGGNQRQAYPSPSWTEDTEAAQLRRERCRLVPRNGESIVSLQEQMAVSGATVASGKNVRHTWPSCRDLKVPARWSPKQESQLYLPLRSLSPTTPQEGTPSDSSKWLILFAQRNRSSAKRLAELLHEVGHNPVLCNENEQQLFSQKSINVVVIVTKDYIQELQEPTLNLTRFLYNRMEREFKEDGRNHRFIPVVDNDNIPTTSIPAFLKKCPAQPTKFIWDLLAAPPAKPKHYEVTIETTKFGRN